MLDCNGDLLLIQGGLRTGSMYVLKRLGTTLRDELSRTLFTGGVDGLSDVAIRPVGPAAGRPLRGTGVSGALDAGGGFGEAASSPGRK